MALLEIQGLSFLEYGPIDLNLNPGEVLGITGPSGSGKTLLVKAIADLIESRGRILLHGQSRDSQAAPTWRRSVMLVPAEPLWWFETVGQHFPENSEPLDCCGLGLAADVLDWPVAQLSSGEKQRLGLARALARKPKLVLLDEPTANLDQQNTRRVEDCVLRYLKEKDRAAIWVSHNSEQLTRVSAEVYGLVDKQLVKEACA